MKLSKTAKTAIGVLTIMQLFAGLGFFIWIFSAIVPKAVALNGDPGPEFIFGLIGGMVFWAIFLSLYTFGLMVFYLVHVGTNDRISIGMKVLWIVLILTFSFVAEVVYYFLDILPEESLSAKLEKG